MNPNTKKNRDYLEKARQSLENIAKKFPQGKGKAPPQRRGVKKQS